MANYNYTPSDQIAIQQKMSEELMNQDMRQGLGRGQKTDWGRGLAHMLRQYQGGQMSRDATAKSEANEELRSQDNALMAELLANPEGQAAPDFASMEIAQGLDPSMVQGAQDQTVALPSMSQAQFSTPQGQQMQLGQIGQLSSESRAQTLADSIYDRDRGDATSDAQRDRDWAIADADRKQLDALAVQKLKNLKPGYTSTPRPIQTSEGYMEVVDGQWVPMQNEDGSRVMSAQYDPVLQGEIAGSKVEGTLVGERNVGMQGLGDVINQTSAILGNTENPPTASGVGSAYDSVAGFFGASPDGSVPASQLKALGGALTAKMPRMEGPQSDQDRLMYLEMAGRVGDDTVPVDQREAALETVKGLWGKYEVGSAPEEATARQKRIAELRARVGN